MPVDSFGRPVSDDGLWYWDGQRWLPTQPQHPSQALPAPASAGSAPAPQVQMVYSVPVQRTNGLAIASAIVGLASYLLCPFIGAAIAVVMGHSARGQIRRMNEGGWGWATAGLILGYAQFAFWGLLLLVFFSVCGGLAALGTLATPRP